MSEAIKQEMEYTNWESACADKALDETGKARECRRQFNHPDQHASNYPYFEWST